MNKSLIKGFLFMLVLIAYRLPFDLSCFGGVTAVYADTHTAVSLSTADVQAAISVASDGDTVLLPPGISTWTATMYLSKGITIKGAGTGQTTIIDDTPDAWWTNKVLQVSVEEGKTWRITGITFLGFVYHAGYPYIIRVQGTCKNWRIDHCTFKNVLNGIWITGSTWGLIDNCTFYADRDLNGLPCAVAQYGDYTAWERPLSLGTSNALYVEDCYINFFYMWGGDELSMYTGGGARYVFRHNTVNVYMESWGIGSDNKYPGERGVSSGEFYENKISKGGWLGHYVSGGTGVFFNNTFTGWGGTPIGLNNQRTLKAQGQWPNSRCDGTCPDDGNLPISSGTYSGGVFSGNNWTANQWVDYAVWNVIDKSVGKITANTSNTLTVTLSGGTRNNWSNGDIFKITNGYPCIDQIGRGPMNTEFILGSTVQVSAPFYEWNNTLAGNPIHFYLMNNCASFPYLEDHIKEGRDYYSGTPMPGYTPYTYPHPLQFIFTDVVDTSSPTAPGVVRDGTSVTADIDFTFSVTQLSANWDAATDAESGISGYKYAIGTAPGAMNITNGWINSTAANVTATGLNLTQNLTYYFTVKAINGSLLESVARSSDGQYITGDATPPGAPAQVRDGTGTDIGSTGSTTQLTQLSANWDAATDNESDISGYKYAIGTSAGGTNIAGWTALGNVLTVTRTGLTLTTGTTYYFSVKAVNGASVEGAATNSDGQYVRLLDKVVYWKLDEGSGTQSQDSSGSGNTGTISGATWTTGISSSGGLSFDGSNDTLSGSYTPPTNNFTICAWIKATTTHEIDTESNSGYPGTSGQRYLFYPEQRGSDSGAGVSAGTNGISVYEHGDSYMPPLAVYSGTLGTSWNHIAVVYENKQPKIYLNGELVRTGLVSPKSTVYAPITVGGGTRGYFPGVVDEVRLYDRALSLAQIQSIYTGISVVDTSSPSAPATVRDGAAASTDIVFTYSTTTLSANWAAASDPESGIAAYQYAIGATPGATNITNGWLANGTNLTVTKTGLTLTVGTTYYFSVKATNGAGLVGSAANSDGQYVKVIDPGDTTPPSPPSTVRDGTGVDIDSMNPITQLSANWSASTDLESGILNYEYAIGTTPGATDITGWTPTGNGELTSVTQTGLSLVIGTTYYFSVKAENGVGLQSTPANSDGVCIISGELPPVISNVQATNITENSVTISWTTDKQATSQVEYGLTAVYGDLTVEDTNLAITHSVAIVNLTAGKTYHYRVISKDIDGRMGASADFNFTTLSTLITQPSSAYPNPYSLSRPGGMKFNFSGQTGGEVSIYTMSGKLVKKLSVDTGAGINWDGTNEDGEKAARGIYVYMLISNNGDKIIGKLAVVR